MHTHSVDPARLHWGEWCHRTDKQVNQGDIAGSYSADRIAMSQPLRKPFTWQGSLWVCISRSNAGAEAYRLTHPKTFSGDTLTYHEKTADGDAARNDPNGFYHGMTATQDGKTYVLCGPSVLLTAGETVQLDLFAAR